MLDFMSFTTQKLNHKLGRNLLGLVLVSAIMYFGTVRIVQLPDPRYADISLVGIKIDGRGKSQRCIWGQVQLLLRYNIPV